MVKVNTDIDIDLADRSEILKKIDCIPASIVKGNEIRKHNTGVYFQDMPINPFTGSSMYDHKEAEDLGYFKVDLLNNSVYTGIKNEEELNELTKEPNWDLLERKDIVEQLPHIHDYFNIINAMKPKSIEQLAMVIALIRPSKYYLLGHDWNKIENEIWQPPSNNEYYFKKSHALAYSVMIVVALNRINRGS